MTKSYPVTKHARAKSLTHALREQPPRVRFTRGMSDAAKRMESDAAHKSDPKSPQK